MSNINVPLKIFTVDDDEILVDGRGYDLLSRMRAAGVTVPVIILYSQKNEMDRVFGLDSGAADYITKPFSLLELQSRVRAAVRRSTRPHAPSGSSAPKQFSAAGLAVDFESGRATCDGRAVQLSYTEFNIIKVLVMNRDRLVGRDELIDLVWGKNVIEPGSLAPHISRLRKKIAPYGDVIENVPKFGYILKPENA